MGSCSPGSSSRSLICSDAALSWRQSTGVPCSVTPLVTTLYADGAEPKTRPCTAEATEELTLPTAAEYHCAGAFLMAAPMKPNSMCSAIPMVNGVGGADSARTRGPFNTAEWVVHSALDMLRPAKGTSSM